jgi:hypothetical protein
MTNDIYKSVTDLDLDWSYIKDIAKEDKSHHLWANYQSINLKTYEHMIVNVRNNTPAAFHGIYNNGRWPSNISRICNRAYITPYFRNLGQGLEITWKNIKYVLDNYDQWNKDVLFISRGVQYDNVSISWRKFEKFCKFLVKNTGYPLIWDDRLYQCCPNLSKDCYQFCVWHDPKYLKKSLNIESITMKEWEKLP